ncbi:MAG: hypothetical protein Q9174_003104 [Haloplaca sp. 1 TL-2023]
MAKTKIVKKPKKASTTAPVAPKDINGDVTPTNELTAKHEASPRSTRKRTGDFNDFEDQPTAPDEDGPTHVTSTSTQPKKKPKVAPVSDKESKTEDKQTPISGKGKKTKPSKTDGHPVVVEKTHPGGDTVEAEPSQELKGQKKTDEKAQGKKQAAQEEPAAKPSSTKASRRKSRADAKKNESTSNLNGESIQAQETNDMTAPEKPRDKTAATKGNRKPQKAADAADNQPKEVPPQTTSKAKPNKEAKAKKDAKAKALEPASEGNADVEPDQAMDEAPFKNLLKRERAKIPSVKASANKAEAERKAVAAQAKKEEKASKGKESKKDTKATKPTKTKASALEPLVDDKPSIAATAPAESSKSDKAPKGKKRKDAPSDPKTEAGSSGKKQKKAAVGAFDAAKNAVGDFVNSGMEAAAQGVNAVKEFAAGFENKSIADDVTAVAEGAVEEKAKKAKAKKNASKDQKGKGKAAPVDDAAATGDFEAFNDESGEDDDFEEGDQTAALIKGFESEGDEEVPGDNAGFKEGMEVPKLPKSKDLPKKLKAIKDTSEGPGVVYVGRIPHGFYEHQMRAYFSQFGPISRLRLSRNRTTGASKHYAFIEFESASVAKIVAETMDTYLMFGHILKCKVVPPEEAHENLWKGANKRFKKVPWNKIEGKKMEKAVGRKQWEKRVENEQKRRSKKAEKAKSFGYEFEAGLKNVEDMPVREVEKKQQQQIEGSAAAAEDTVVQEKTLVTTDGMDGSLVFSEELKTKRTKKPSKRKAEADKEEGPLKEVVKKAKKAKSS